MKRDIRSWGNIFNKEVEEINFPIGDQFVLSFGNQNSYGDSSLPLNNFTVKNTYVNKNNYYLSPTTTINDYLLSKNKIIYGIPGKSNVTLAGAIASDTHGKDNLWGGGFHKNVDSILIRINDEIIRASRTENVDLFEATIGGYGLSGQIIGVKLRSNTDIFNSYITRYNFGNNVENLLDSFSFVKNNYWVGWVDLLDKKKKWISESSSPIRNNNYNFTSSKNDFSDIPMGLAFVGKNRLKSLSFINNFYFYLHKNKKDKYKKLNDILYPISKFTDTRLISKKNKIIQVQFSIPIAKAKQADHLLEKLIFNQRPLLCSVKRISNPEFNNNLSFLQDGWTFAIDFAYEDFDHLSIRDFYSELIKNNGKIYLAKDSTLRPDEFHKMFPEYKRWIEVVNYYDKNKNFQSLMSKRLNLK